MLSAPVRRQQYRKNHSTFSFYYLVIVVRAARTPIRGSCIGARGYSGTVDSRTTPVSFTCDQAPQTKTIVVEVQFHSVLAEGKALPSVRCRSHVGAYIVAGKVDIFTTEYIAIIIGSWNDDYDCVRGAYTLHPTLHRFSKVGKGAIP
jgi:hypothetical protein